MLTTASWRARSVSRVACRTPSDRSTPRNRAGSRLSRSSAGEAMTAPLQSCCIGSPTLRCGEVTWLARATSPRRASPAFAAATDIRRARRKRWGRYAWVARMEGELERALGLLRESRALCEAAGFRWWLAGMLANIGAVSLELGRLDDARSSAPGGAVDLASHARPARPRLRAPPPRGDRRERGRPTARRDVSGRCGRGERASSGRPLVARLDRSVESPRARRQSISHVGARRADGWSSTQPSRPRSAMPDLPTGTVTFFFTDVEGSTRAAPRARRGRLCSRPRGPSQRRP